MTKNARLALMHIKLLALDIDGTLLNSHHKLTEHTKATVQKAVEAGVKVALVTGRRFHAALPIAQELELQLPLVSHNGALTKDAKTLEIFDYHPLDKEVSKELVLIGREYKADTLCCDDPTGEGLLVFENISERNVRLRAYVALFQQYARQVTDLCSYINHLPIQVFYVGSCKLMDEMSERLAKEFDGSAKVVLTAYRSADMAILDVINPNSSKGAALKTLADSLSIDRSEIMAVGDNQNDLEMLEYAGLPVMMANSEAILHGRGFATTLSNEEDGVAVAIEKYILKS